VVRGNSGITQWLEHLARDLKIMGSSLGHVELALWMWAPHILPSSSCPKISHMLGRIIQSIGRSSGRWGQLKRDDDMCNSHYRLQRHICEVRNPGQHIEHDEIGHTTPFWSALMVRIIWRKSLFSPKMHSTCALVKISLSFSGVLSGEHSSILEVAFSSSACKIKCVKV